MVPKQVQANRLEGFPPAWGRVARRPFKPPRLARLAARVRPGALDRALIAGCDPARSCQLATRAATLTSKRHRSMIADGLERMLQAAQRSPSSRIRVRPRREAVLANAVELRELAAEVRGTAPLYARGIAIVAELLSDGTGPAYLGDGDTLARRLHEARAALCGQDTAPARERCPPRDGGTG